VARTRLAQISKRFSGPASLSSSKYLALDSGEVSSTGEIYHVTEERTEAASEPEQSLKDLGTRLAVISLAEQGRKARLPLDWPGRFFRRSSRTPRVEEVAPALGATPAAAPWRVEATPCMGVADEVTDRRGRVLD